MRANRVFLALSICAISTLGLAQVDINNYAYASSYDPDLSEDRYVVNNPHVWDNIRATTVKANSKQDPNGYPENFASAFSTFIQPEYDDAALRARSFGHAYLSSQTSGQRAGTSFDLLQQFLVTAGASKGFQVRLMLAVPMHGFFSAQGLDAGKGLAEASAGLRARVTKGVNQEVASMETSLSIKSDGFDSFVVKATGAWEDDVSASLVDLPLNGSPSKVKGVELTSFELLDLGMLPSATPSFFSVGYQLTTSIQFGSPYYSHALADLSGTGNLTFLAFDEAGNPYHDFTVSPVMDAVPEPASLAILGLGLLAVLRRRRTC